MCASPEARILGEGLRSCLALCETCLSFSDKALHLCRRGRSSMQLSSAAKSVVPAVTGTGIYTMTPGIIS